MTKKILIGALAVVLVGALAVAALDLWSGSASAEGGQQHGRSAQHEGSDNHSLEAGNGHGGSGERQGGHDEHEDCSEQDGSRQADGKNGRDGEGGEGGKGRSRQEQEATVSGTAGEAGSKGRGRQEQEATVSGTAGEAGSKGRGRQEQESAVSDMAGEASRGQGNGRDAAGRQGQESGQANSEPEASVEEWLTYEGSVVALDDEGVTIATGDGQELAIKLGPPWYRESLDFSAEVGDRISVVGFYDEDHFEAGQVANQANGQTLILRDEDGRPLWAGGRGRQGQR